MKFYAISAIWIAAAAGYAFHDGADPWIAAIIGTFIMIFVD